MKFLVVFVGLAVAVAAYEPILTRYHEEVGIPEAARIMQAEAAMDFDGSRITGGQLAAVGTHPHLAALIVLLTDNRQAVCGSTLLSNTRLVTSAHCWRSRGTNSVNQGVIVTVVLGSDRVYSGGTRISTTTVEVHDNYNINTLNNNIAIISIPHVAYTNVIQNINLATGTDQYVGTWATAAGFGRTDDFGSGVHNEAKHEVDLEVITNDECARVYGRGVIIDSTLCVNTPRGQSTCSGDSGGPLAIGTGSSRTLIGISSFGHRDGCTFGYPAGFSRITSFVSWINARL